MARKKITATTDNSEWKAPKKRKPRKPMTDEQKAAASERLAKAREARAAKNPDYGKTNIHESLRDLDDEHQLSPKRVKEWIKVQKDYAKSERAAVRQKIKGAEAKLAMHDAYIRSMLSYLRTGDWIDMFYGEAQEGRIMPKCVVMAYNSDGTAKRDVGTWYPDMGIYTKEMRDGE